MRHRDIYQLRVHRSCGTQQCQRRPRLFGRGGTLSRLARIWSNISEEERAKKRVLADSRVSPVVAEKKRRGCFFSPFVLIFSASIYIAPKRFRFPDTHLPGVIGPGYGSSRRRRLRMSDFILSLRYLRYACRLAKGTRPPPPLFLSVFLGIELRPQGNDSFTLSSGNYVILTP